MQLLIQLWLYLTASDVHIWPGTRECISFIGHQKTARVQGMDEDDLWKHGDQ